MSDFLLVIPSGWTQLPWDTVFNHPLINVDAVAMWAQSSQLPYLAELLVETGLLQPGQEIIEVRMIDNTYFLVKLG